MQEFASQNTQPLGELLTEFFHYFATGFDYKHMAIAIEKPQSMVSKDIKAEVDCWKQVDRLR